MRVGNGEWKDLNVSTIKTDSHRFSLKCNLNGVLSTFSAVITPNQIDIFNEVIANIFQHFKIFFCSDRLLFLFVSFL